VTEGACRIDFVLNYGSASRLSEGVSWDQPVGPCGVSESETVGRARRCGGSSGRVERRGGGGGVRAGGNQPETGTAREVCCLKRRTVGGGEHENTRGALVVVEKCSYCHHRSRLSSFVPFTIWLSDSTLSWFCFL